MINFSEGKFILKFGAVWCSSCKTLDKVLPTMNIKVPIVSIDIDDNPELAKKYCIRALPTLVVVNNEVELKKVVGFLSTNEYLGKLKETGCVWNAFNQSCDIISMRLVSAALQSLSD